MEYEITMNKKVVDIDDYLPFRTPEDIRVFLNPADGLLKEKKDAFKERLYAAGNTTSMTAFITGIVAAVFDSPLLGSHKWPYKK